MSLLPVPGFPVSGNLVWGCLLLALGLSSIALAQVSPDQAAEMILTSARQAYNEGNVTFATTRFREFLQKHGNHPQANSTRLALGICYLELPESSFDKAIEVLSPLAGNNTLPEYPQAVYFMGIANRGLGLIDLNQAAAKPNDSQALRARAAERFTEAARLFQLATTAFTARVAKKDTDPKEKTLDLDWAARARADQAEMELRLGKYKEARATTEPFLKDATLAKIRYRSLGLYYHGFAAYLLQDYLVAGRALNQLSPFNDPIYGLHARFLMGRVYQISGEKDKATTYFDHVLTDYDAQKKAAIEALKRPEQFRNQPAEKLRLETLVKIPPEHVAGAAFYSAAILYESGKFPEALSRFQTFAKQYPASNLVPEAVLRIGFCQVQTKQYPEAIATLTPLLEKSPAIADQILFWIGKAQAGLAIAIDPTKTAERENGLRQALATMRSAADKANQLATNDPLAKQRRAEFLLEIADNQQLLKQHREAATIYEQIVAEKVLPTRSEELRQRLISTYHLAGDYDRSDQLCASFVKDYPQSALLGIVAFRFAENAYFRALKIKSKPEYANRAPEVMKLFEDAIKKYREVVANYPELDRVHLARYGLAMCHFHRNEFEEAQKALEEIPVPERTGELAYAPYLLADCLMRQAPRKAEDALAAGMLQEKLANAHTNLDAFIAANPKAPEIPDAMLKLGYCQTRLALLNAVPQERGNLLQSARQTYEKLMQQFPKEPQAVQAIMERAKCLAFAGDRNGAMNELRKFTQDPLQQNAPYASIAVIQLATYLREANQPEEASKVLAAARQKHEPVLQNKDNERIALLRYHHGVALYEANKPAEARQLLDGITQLVPNSPLILEATLRTGQARIAEGKKIIEQARQQLGQGNLKPDQRTASEKLLQSGYAMISEAAQLLERRGEEFRDKFPTSEARARMFYEAAWAWRLVAEAELAASKLRIQHERQKNLQAEADKKARPGTTASTVPLPEVTRLEIPLQPAETRARAAYQLLINGFSDLMLAVEARLELAELHADRDEHDQVIRYLKEALDKEPVDRQPTPEFLDKLQLRLGVAQAAKRLDKEAIERFERIANNPKSPLYAQGQYRLGECLFVLGETEKAITRLSIFRDKPEFHNIPGVSDRALLRLGQAHAVLKQWDASRQTLETMVSRFGGSPWIVEARYALGWALQNLGQFDPAVVQYNTVIAATPSQIAARAHLQVGLCRLEQKKYADAVTSLLIVPFTFDFPELSAAALSEAARALHEDKKPEQAERLLQRVIKDYPQSEWAKIAQQRLEQWKPASP